MRFVATLICMILVGLSHAKHANDEKDFLLKEIVKLEKKRLPGVGGDVFRVGVPKVLPDDSQLKRELGKKKKKKRHRKSSYRPHQKCIWRLTRRRCKCRHRVRLCNYKKFCYHSYGHNRKPFKTDQTRYFRVGKCHNK
jgi:hypothetical protein